MGCPVDEPGEDMTVGPTLMSSAPNVRALVPAPPEAVCSGPSHSLLVSGYQTPQGAILTGGTGTRREGSADGVPRTVPGLPLPR